MPRAMTVEDAEYIRDTYFPPKSTGRPPLPHLYIRDVLGCKTWSKQDEIAISTFVNKVTAVKTCNAVGKSYIAARIVVTWLTLIPGSVVVTTAPTWRQVKDVLWREIGMAVASAPYKLTDKEVKQAALDIDKDWFAVGLSTNYPENFFGYHANFILVVVDEAGGVPEPIFTGVKAITPNANAHILYIGNPTEASGTFFEIFNNPALPANRITISAFDSPNFTLTGIKTLEDLLDLFTPPEGADAASHMLTVNAQLEQKMDPTFVSLIAPSVVYERYHEWGTDSPAWQALIMGQFPSQATQALIPAELVTMAMGMHGVDEDSGKTYAELSGWNIPDGPPEFGLDIARFGADHNVLTPRRGGWVDQQITWGKKGDEQKELFETAENTFKLVNPLDWNTRLNLDDTGVGGGVTSHFRYLSREEMGSGRPAHQFMLVPYNMSSKENMAEPHKFHDIMSELAWNLRGFFMRKQIALYYDKDLYSQIVGRRWFLNKSGKIQVESKDDYKDRTKGKSPDEFDSLCLAFAGGLRESIAPEKRHTSTATGTMRKPYTSGLKRGGMGVRQW